MFNTFWTDLHNILGMIKCWITDLHVCLVDCRCICKFYMLQCLYMLNNVHAYMQISFVNAIVKMEVKQRILLISFGYFMCIFIISNAFWILYLSEYFIYLYSGYSIYVFFHVISNLCISTSLSFCINAQTCLVYLLHNIIHVIQESREGIKVQVADD